MSIMTTLSFDQALLYFDRNSSRGDTRAIQRTCCHGNRSKRVSQLWLADENPCSSGVIFILSLSRNLQQYQIHYKYRYIWSEYRYNILSFPFWFQSVPHVWRW